MASPATRRDFLRATSAVAATQLVPSPRPESEAAEPAGAGKPVRVLVWDERQPAQKDAYENFLGNAIADHLRSLPGFSVQSVGIDDPERGLADQVVGACDVLIWWGHVRQAEVPVAAGRAIVERIKAGTLGLVTLHSAHWSTPFVEAMNERTRIDAEAALRANRSERVEIEYVPPPKRYTTPKYDTRLTPYTALRKYPDGRTTATVQLPYCCFPAYRHDGIPSSVRVLKPGHPLASGVPERFEISRTEMYDEPFHVPEPDEVILEERWPGGEWFRSGMVWTLGKGRVVYFRPGHETYPVFREAMPLRIVANAARWLGSRPS